MLPLSCRRDDRYRDGRDRGIIGDILGRHLLDDNDHRDDGHRCGDFLSLFSSFLSYSLSFSIVLLGMRIQSPCMCAALHW